MSVKEYNFEGVKSSISRGSNISNSMDNIQEYLEELRKKINELEKVFHGKGYKSILYRTYDELYNEIGNSSYGFWGTLRNAKSSLDFLYDSAVEDKRLWDEEQERLRREREERERREKEERERKESAKQYTGNHSTNKYVKWW